MRIPASVSRHATKALYLTPALLGLVVATSQPPAAAATGAFDGATVAAPHILWPAGHTAGTPNPSQHDDLIFHGGAVEHHPAVYIIFWGTEWQQGFTAGDSQGTWTSKAAQRYITQFFGGLGGSAWNGTQTQYCDNVAYGSTSCAGQGYAQYISNPKDLLKGVWVDPAPVPAMIVTSGLAENITQDPLAQEAVKAADHFGFNIDATYMIFTPKGHQATAYGSVYCAYHTEVTNLGGHGIKYSFMPFVPEQGAGCGAYYGNAKADAYGHGYFDGYSEAAGHEFAEAETDPDAWPTQDGWNDASTSENGDKCAYFHVTNIKLGRQYFAVQPMWSNEANGGNGGCAMARGTGPAPVMPPTPVGP